MSEQMNIKRQVRYKDDSIYDILADFNLGEHKYSIIGKELGNKFSDIDFVEQKEENGKIKYISPNSNFEFNKDTTDFKSIQGRALMNYIINYIKDSINDERLLNSTDTLKYIDTISKVISSSNNIGGFFNNSYHYDNELQLEESIKTLIGYYIQAMNDYVNVNELPVGGLLVSDAEVDAVYNDLEKDLEDTQNFGVSLIHDTIKNPDDYIIDPTNNVFVNNSNLNVEKNEEFLPKEESTINIDINNQTSNDVVDENVSKSDEINNRKLSFQEEMYLANEEKMHNKENEMRDLQLDKPKTLVLTKSTKMNNAAYITISLLLYLIGSFELLLSIILIAKFL